MSVLNFDIETLNKDQVVDSALTVLNKMHDILINSYGPLGGNTILHRNGAPPVVTKDGWTILQDIRFDEPAQLDIYQLIKTISGNLVDRVGDGSTSAILVATHLYIALQSIYKHSNPLEFKEALRILQDMIIANIDTYLTKEVTTDTKQDVLSRVAAVSNNNNLDIGERVAGIFAHLNSESLVDIQLSPEENAPSIAYNLKEGFNTRDCRLGHNFYFSSKIFAQGMKLLKPDIAITFSIDAVMYEALVKATENFARPLIIIAESIEPAVKTAIYRDGMGSINANKIPKIILLEVSDLATQRNMDSLLDLDTYLDSNYHALSNSSLEDLQNINYICSCLGYAEEVFISPTGEVTFVKGQGSLVGTENFLERVNDLRKQYSEIPATYRVQRGTLKIRLNRLNGTNATVFVGGRTEEEKKNLKFLVEDSVLACQSVLKHGYTLGSNYASLYAVKQLKQMMEDDLAEDDLELFEKFKNTSLPMELVESILHAYLDMQETVIRYNRLAVPEFLKLLGTDSTVKFDIYRHTALLNLKNNTTEYFSTSTKEIPNVICAVSTDKEILSASFSIVELLLSSNQYIRFN